MNKSLVFVTALLFALPAYATTQELIDSVKKDDLPAVLNLLEHGENVNAANEQGNTALHYAVAKDNAAITQALLLYGADINASNTKGWTPMKIAEKKELKNVNSLLENAANKLSEKRVNAENVVKEASGDIRLRAQKAMEKVAQQSAETSAKVEQVAEKAQNIAEEGKEIIPSYVDEKLQIASPEVKEEIPANEVKEPAVAETRVTEQVIEAKIAEVKQAIEHKAEENTKLNAEKKSLEDEVAKLRAENASLNEKLKEVSAKAESAKPVVAETKPAETKVTETKATENNISKPADKVKAKPIAKKPVAKKPQPVVKKVVVKPSSLISTIYEGDEEIIYCLSYLGHGENQNMGKAAAYFAASSQVKEARYQQIADMTDVFFNQASGEELQKRNAECGKIITPKDKDKQNQIIRSLNQSVGY